MKDMEDHLNQHRMHVFVGKHQDEITQPAHLDRAIKRLEYHLVDREPRSRRDNTLVFNVANIDNEDTVHLLKTCIKHKQHAT